MMRTPLVAGNWKMNGSQESIKALLSAISSGSTNLSGVDIAVCPPAIYIPVVAQILAKSHIAYGGQNVCEKEKGAFTGEIATSMLLDFSCKYVIIGHSERRSIYNESDSLVAEKFVAAKQAGLIPILCVGETLDEREQNITEKVVARQLDAVTAVDNLDNAVIAYEPVWAIGTGKTASPEQAQEVHAFIRQHLTQSNADIAQKVQILYGGSVKGSNAQELFAKEDIDGGLIGGASLDAEDFLRICQAAV